MSKLSEYSPCEEQLQNKRRKVYEGFVALHLVTFNMHLQEGESGPKAREVKSNRAGLNGQECETGNSEKAGK